MMKNFKTIRETMTEQALSIESVMRGNRYVYVGQLVEACQLSEATVEFILTQMESVSMVQQLSKCRWMLTQNYRCAD